MNKDLVSIILRFFNNKNSMQYVFFWKNFIMQKAREALQEKKQKQAQNDENRAKALEETKISMLREENKQLKKKNQRIGR